jgi:hypothetical protein
VVLCSSQVAHSKIAYFAKRMQVSSFATTKTQHDRQLLQVYRIDGFCRVHSMPVAMTHEKLK